MNKKKVYSIIGLIIIVLAILVGPIVTRFPLPQADRVDGDNLVGVEAGGSFSWVIPTNTGVVLVDAGWDTDATAIKEEIAGRTVHAIFITHGHFDHTGALATYPDATVYIGPGEGPLVRGEVEPMGWMAKMSTSMMGSDPYTPPILVTINDGETIEVDGEIFVAIHVPGHTSGSAMYIWQDVLFAGDTIVGRGDYVNEAPKGTYYNYELVRSSVAKVLDYSFDRMADGHVGLHENVYHQVEAFVEK